MEFSTDTDFRYSGRWHKSRSYLSATVPTVTAIIASEHSWFNGYARYGVHIEAKNNRIQDGFSSWSMGAAVELPSVKDREVGRYVDRDADTAYSFNTAKSAWIAGLGYALLRDVREPAEPIFDVDLSDSWYRIIQWRKMLLHRAATFYGTDSPQYKALYALVLKRDDRETADLAVPATDAIPRWRHIQSRMAMAGKPPEEQVVWRSILH